MKSPRCQVNGSFCDSQPCTGVKSCDEIRVSLQGKLSLMKHRFAFGMSSHGNTWLSAKRGKFPLLTKTEIPTQCSMCIRWQLLQKTLSSTVTCIWSTSYPASGYERSKVFETMREGRKKGGEQQHLILNFCYVWLFIMSFSQQEASQNWFVELRIREAFDCYDTISVWLVLSLQKAVSQVSEVKAICYFCFPDQIYKREQDKVGDGNKSSLQAIRWDGGDLRKVRTASICFNFFPSFVTSRSDAFWGSFIPKQVSKVQKSKALPKNTKKNQPTKIQNNSLGRIENICINVYHYTRTNLYSFFDEFRAERERERFWIGLL